MESLTSHESSVSAQEVVKVPVGVTGIVVAEVVSLVVAVVVVPEREWHQHRKRRSFPLLGYSEQK